MVYGKSTAAPSRQAMHEIEPEGGDGGCWMSAVDDGMEQPMYFQYGCVPISSVDLTARISCLAHLVHVIIRICIRIRVQS
jgi:hypothetical protein